MGCFKNSFTTLKAYIHLFRGHVQCFELSWYGKTHRVWSGIVTVECDFHWWCGALKKKRALLWFSKCCSGASVRKTLTFKGVQTVHDLMIYDAWNITFTYAFNHNSCCSKPCSSVITQRTYCLTRILMKVSYQCHTESLGFWTLCIVRNPK
jgi:hypothetical protein